MGSNVGVLLGAVIIFPNLTPAEERAELSGQAIADAVDSDLAIVLGPHLGSATVLVLMWLLIAFRKMPTPAEEGEALGSKGVLRRLVANPEYRYGVIGQLFSRGAQTCTWTFTIQYATDVVVVYALYDVRSPSPAEAGAVTSG